MRKTGIIFVMTCVFAMTLAPMSFAQGSGEATAWTKLLNGLSNTLLGWTELPRRIYSVSQEEGMGQGLTRGLIDGLAYGIARTGAGAIDTALFFMPPFDEPIMDPLYNF
jgi:putative exosortase-associated protein (TIGR04073 family)